MLPTSPEGVAEGPLHHQQTLIEKTVRSGKGLRSFIGVASMLGPARVNDAAEVPVLDRSAAPFSTQRCARQVAPGAR